MNISIACDSCWLSEFFDTVLHTWDVWSMQHVQYVVNRVWHHHTKFCIRTGASVSRKHSTHSPTRFQALSNTKQLCSNLLSKSPLSPPDISYLWAKFSMGRKPLCCCSLLCIPRNTLMQTAVEERTLGLLNMYIAVSISTSTSALSVIYRGVSGYYVCSDQWTTLFSHAVCLELGYASVYLCNCETRSTELANMYLLVWIDQLFRVIHRSVLGRLFYHNPRLEHVVTTDSWLTLRIHNKLQCG